MQKIILWGTGYMSQVVEYFLNLEGLYEICAYTLDEAWIKEKYYNNKPVIAFDEVEKKYPPSEYKMAILMSPKKVNKLREEKYLQAKEKGYSFIKYVSKNSDCYADDIGENTFIFPHTCVQPFCKIGNNVCLWPESALGHHVIIEDNCFLAGPKIAGFTKIEKNCFLGTNCTLADHLTIGAYSIIGIGSVVTKNIKNCSVLAVKPTEKLPMTSFELEDIID